jgi:carbonic anhydrase
MHRRQALKVLAGLALCPLCAPKGFAADAHWSYEGTADGPARWGELDPANRVCSAGVQQSPIDIGETVKAQLPPLKLTWARTPDTIVNNGHTIQLNMGEGSTLSVGGGAGYRLVQFHFHRPSEHTINGASFPMEAHFVHQNAAGSLAVVGVLMTGGRPNKTFNNLVLSMPNRAGPPVKADPKIDPNALLPSKRSYYRYSGSLTTPPCSETVDWYLLTEPVQVADADINSFATLYKMNARPAQKPNRRFVLRSP